MGQMIYLHDLMMLLFQPPPQKVVQEVTKVAQKEAKIKPSAKKKVDPPKIDDNALETGKHYSGWQSAPFPLM